METVFQLLAANPYIQLLLVGLAVGTGRVTLTGDGPRMVASAVAVASAIATTASRSLVELDLNNVAKSLFYCLFMHGVGLRVSDVAMVLS